MEKENNIANNAADPMNVQKLRQKKPRAMELSKYTFRYRNAIFFKAF